MKRLIRKLFIWAFPEFISKKYVVVKDSVVILTGETLAELPLEMAMPINIKIRHGKDLLLPPDHSEIGVFRRQWNTGMSGDPTCYGYVGSLK